MYILYQIKLREITGIFKMSNFGGLIQEYYVELFRQNAKLRQKKLAALKTPEDVYKYIITNNRKNQGEMWKNFKLL